MKRSFSAALLLATGALLALVVLGPDHRPLRFLTLGSPWLFVITFAFVGITFAVILWRVVPEKVHAYRLRITQDALLCEQAWKEPVSLPLAEIEQITEIPGNGLRVESPDKAIAIPYGIESYRTLRDWLAGIRPIRVRSAYWSSIWVAFAIGFLGTLVVGLHLTDRDPLVIATTGTLLILVWLACIVRMRRDKTLGRSERISIALTGLTFWKIVPRVAQAIAELLS